MVLGGNTIVGGSHATVKGMEGVYGQLTDIRGDGDVIRDVRVSVAPPSVEGVCSTHVGAMTQGPARYGWVMAARSVEGVKGQLTHIGGNGCVVTVVRPYAATSSMEGFSVVAAV